MKSAPKTLVTGATGFLGRHLVDRLLEAGEPVRVLTRSDDPGFESDAVEVIVGDLDDPNCLNECVAGIQRIYHLAGRVTRDPSRAHLMYSLHVEGTQRLLDAARAADGIERIVVASTSGTVGVSSDPEFIADDASPMAENTVRRWPYYLSKIFAERLCQQYVRDHDLPIIVMRPTLLLGPGDWRESSTSDVVLFLKRRVPALMSGGISFVDVRDTADAFIAAMEKGRDGQTYLLGARNCTLQQFFETLQDLTGIPAPKIPVPDGAARFGARMMNRALSVVGLESDLDPVTVDMATHYWYIDWSKASQELGFEPRDPARTLRDTVRWIEANHPDFSDGRRSINRDFVSPEMESYAEKLRGESER